MDLHCHMRSQSHRQSFFAMAGVFSTREREQERGSLRDPSTYGPLCFVPWTKPPRPLSACLESSVGYPKPQQQCSGSIPGCVSRIRGVFRRARFVSKPSPFCSPPRGTEDGFVALNQEDCFTSSGHSCSPLPCCKTPALAREQWGHCAAARYHPDFTSVLSDPGFCSPSKESICSGEGRGCSYCLH